MRAAINDGFLRIGTETWEARWIGPGPDEAPTLVFLHEGLGCVSMWKDFPDQLVAATGCGGLVYSRAGYGRSDPISLPRPLDYMQEEGRIVLPKILDALDIERAVLVGHSDGASIALVHSGLDTKNRVAGLIAEAPHVFAEDMGLDSIGEIGSLYETTDLRARLARHHGDNVDCAFFGWNGAWSDPKFSDWNIEGYLPGISAPVLLIQGEDDEYGTAEQLHAIERQAGGEVTTALLPDCGHSPHRDQAAAVLKVMADFVGRVLA
jgi:pimeloyl-ACP methyl ester carboxylesterase